MDTLESLITNEKVRGIIAVVAAIIMFVAPIISIVSSKRSSPLSVFRN